MNERKNDDKPILKLKNDYVFRYVFTRPEAREALKDLLVSILDIPESEVDMEAVAKKSNPMRECVMVVRKMSRDEAERRLALAQEKAERDERARLEWAQEQGLEQGKIEIARGMKAKGLDPALIHELTGLSVEEIV
jgi:hypothetical protein